MVANVIGKLLAFDITTRECRGMSYARVCVELSGNFSMRTEITIRLGGRTLVYLLLMNGNPLNVILVILLVTLLDIVLDI